MKITFVIGGARSGKSSFALKEASKSKGPKAYIATAEAFDDEIKERIEQHRVERGDEWDTFEEPVKIGSVLADIRDKYSAVLLDCLTVWLSNTLHYKMDSEIEINNFVNSLSDMKEAENSPGDRSPEHPCHLLIVSNEVGAGIVPENKLARQFRDLSGLLNQKVAEIAREVYWVTAGIPIKIKG